MSDHDSYNSSNSNCIFTFMSYQTYTRSTVQMAVQSSGDIMNMEGISCEFSVKIPAPKSCIEDDILDEDNLDLNIATKKHGSSDRIQ